MWKLFPAALALNGYLLLLYWHLGGVSVLLMAYALLAAAAAFSVVAAMKHQHPKD